MLGKQAKIDFIALKWQDDLHSIVNFSVTELTIFSFQLADPKSLSYKMLINTSCVHFEAIYSKFKSLFVRLNVK